MERLLVIAALVVLAYRMLLGRWPWETRPSPGERALAQARAVLGVSAGAQRSDILAAHRRRLTLVHPDKGGTEARVHEADAARDMLLANLPHPTIPDPKEPS